MQPCSTPELLCYSCAPVVVLFLHPCSTPVPIILLYYSCTPALLLYLSTPVLLLYPVHLHTCISVLFLNRYTHALLLEPCSPVLPLTTVLHQCSSSTPVSLYHCSTLVPLYYSCSHYTPVILLYQLYLCNIPLPVHYNCTPVTLYYSCIPVPLYYSCTSVPLN